MNSKSSFVLCCFLFICNKSYPQHIDQEEVVGTNGTNASFSLEYLTNEFQNKKLEDSVVIKDSILKTTETIVSSIPHSLITNGVISSDGLSDTGQVPVVVTLLDSNTQAANVIALNLQLIRNKTRSPPGLSEPPLRRHNESSFSAAGDATTDSVDSTQRVTIAPPPRENNTVGGRGNESEAPPTPVSAPGQEDIPSFREWTQKQLAEAEKKGENLTVLTPAKKNSNVKIRSKNYASLDCGAKIVGSNPEAKSPNSVLSPSRDEYILSPCTSKIWFVVELCESIQAKKIELANFELFSSSPREFTVWVADRWTTKDWTLVGQFTARDERTVQSFPLSHSLFAKYLKLEFHSHYGAEHFCPVSLLRVFGTSELDVLEDVHDLRDMEEDEEVADETEGGEGGNNIFGSARDAVISIVKKAAEVLTPQQQAKNSSDLTSLDPNDSSSSGQLTQLRKQSCSSPAHIIVCDNCTDDLYHAVYSELSCRRKQIETLCEAPFIERVLRTTTLCAAYGLHFLITPDPAYGNSDDGIRKSVDTAHGIPVGVGIVRKFCTLEKNHEDQRLLKSFLADHQMAALCNHLAILDNKVVYNITQAAESLPPQSLPSSHSGDSSEGIDSKSHHLSSLSPQKKQQDLVKTNPQSTRPLPPQFCTIESSLVAFPRTSNSGMLGGESATLALLPGGIRTTQAEAMHTSSPGVQDQIRPTKTLDHSDEEDRRVSMDHSVEGTSTVTVLDSSGDVSNQDEMSVDREADNKPHSPSVLTTDTHEMAPPPSDSGEEIGGVESLETLFSDLEGVADPAQPQQTPPPQQQQLKESVLIRLANRIKALERNMSLSGQYLDELSRRYKRQIEELSRALAEARTETKRGETREMKLQAELSVLAQQLASLTVSVESVLTERESWLYKMSTIGQHTVIILVELVIFVAILFLCRVLPEVELSQRKISLAWRSPEQKTLPSTARRKSDSALPADSGEVRRRRPSEEAMRSSGSTHTDLMIPPSTPLLLPRPLTKAEKRRKRRKKEVKLKMSSSLHSLPRYPSGPRLKRTSSSDQVAWYPEVSIQNAFEPLTTALQSPLSSPVQYGGMFTTAMSARSKRSIGSGPTGDQDVAQYSPQSGKTSLSVPENSSTNPAVRKISQGSTSNVRKNLMSGKNVHARENSVGRGDSDVSNGRSVSNSSSNPGTPKKSSGFKKYVKKFF